MNKAKFWSLIETAQAESGGDPDEQAKILTGKLAELAPGEIVQFKRLFEEQMALACRWDLRGAAHIINSGCSDQDFEAFRAWLISQGKEVFEDALNDPDGLVEVADADVLCPQMITVADRAYRAKTKSEMPPQEPIEVEPVGEEWVEEDLPEMFPRLWEEFGEEA